MMMAFVPASFEIFAFFLFAPYVLGITRVEAAVMGAVLGAVSPAVVIPRMVQLMENSYGTQKSIPQMIMAGASCDDIFVIVLFTTFVRWRREEAQRRRTLCRFRFRSCSALCWEPLQVMCWQGFLKRHTPCPLCPKQHEGDPGARSVVSFDGSGNVAERNRSGVRAFSGCEHGVHVEGKMCAGGFEAPV